MSEADWVRRPEETLTRTWASGEAEQTGKVVPYMHRDGQILKLVSDDGCESFNFVDHNGIDPAQHYTEDEARRAREQSPGSV